MQRFSHIVYSLSTSFVFKIVRSFAVLIKAVNKFSGIAVMTADIVKASSRHHTQEGSIFCLRRREKGNGNRGNQCPPLHPRVKISGEKAQPHPYPLLVSFDSGIYRQLNVKLTWKFYQSQSFDVSFHLMPDNALWLWTHWTILYPQAPKLLSFRKLILKKIHFSFDQ